MVNTIARANGYPANRLCPPGEALTISPLQVNTNSYLDNPNYQRLMASILGSFGPHLRFKEQEQSCFQTVLIIVISVVAVAVAWWLAPILFPAMFGIAGGLGTLAAGVTTGMTAALVDASLQGIAVGIGALDKFSLIQVLEAGLAGGIGITLQGENGLLHQFAAAARAAQTQLATTLLVKIVSVQAAIALSNQMAELALGLRKYLDLGAIMKTVSTAIIDLGARAKLHLLDIGNNLTLMQTINSELVNTTEIVLGKAIMGLPITLKGILAEELGSVLGAQIGHGVQTVFAKTGHLPGLEYSQSAAKGQGAHESKLNIPARTHDQEPDYHDAIKSTSNKPVHHEPQPRPSTSKAWKPSPDFDIAKQWEQTPWNSWNPDWQNDTNEHAYRRPETYPVKQA